MLTMFKRVFDDNKDMFTSDFVLVGALKRTLSLSDGFRKHIRDRNFICAGTLLRAHLDTAGRVSALSLVKKARAIRTGAEDPKRPEADYFEIVECFYETERITGNLMACWHMTARMRAAGQTLLLAPRAKDGR
jgi:hypothetical protein